MALAGIAATDSSGTIVAFGNVTLVVDSSGGGSGSSTSLFSQTTAVTVSNTGTETTLIGSGVGSVTIPANTWSVGERLTGNAQGIYSVRDTTAGYVEIELLAGGTSLFTIRITPTESQSNQPWSVSYDLVRYSTGGTGTVRGVAWLKYQEANSPAIEVGAGHTDAVTLASNSDQALNVTADWQNGDIGNIWECYLHTYTIIGTSA